MSDYREIPDLPVNQYNAIKAVRNSTMKHFVRSPRHYQYFSTAQSPRTTAMEFGTMFHTFIFEPGVFAKSYILIDEEQRPDKKHGMSAKENAGWKEHLQQLAQAQGGGTYTMDDLEKMEAMKASILENPIAAQLLAEEGQHEFTAIWNYVAEYFSPGRGTVMKAIEVKVRLDKLIPISSLNRKVIVDLKTTDNGDPDVYDRKAWELNYHRAGAIYTDTVGADDFYLIVVEKDAPYVACVYLIDESLIMKGRHDESTGYVPILNGIAKCRDLYGSEFNPDSKQWPGYEWKANEDGDLLLKAPYYK